MLLVWVVLQYSEALCCLFGQSCNIERRYVACLGRLAIFEASMLLVMPHLQYSDLLFILFDQS